MQDNLNQTIWLIGTGPMAIQYAKILHYLKVNFITIGRGEESALKFQNETGITPFIGGVNKYIALNPIKPNFVIVCVNVESLYEVSIEVLNYCNAEILIEKPGALKINDLIDMKNKSNQIGTSIYIAYNRRFLPSIRKVKELVLGDGGIATLHFEFTEWSHVISKLNKPKEQLNEWFFANSSHVADLAFYLSGRPIKMTSIVSGNLDWFDKGSIFVGAGETTNKVLFTYNSNWKGPGRWLIEITTNINRYLLSPLETLQVQNKLSFHKEQVDLSELVKNNENNFKPGLYMQLINFLTYNRKDMCSLNDQIENFHWFAQIQGRNPI
jgi:predicted dehydrogenase